jgi:predicted phage terminase large subunit-like protein
VIPASIRAQAELELRRRQRIIQPPHYLDLAEYTEKTTGFQLEDWQHIVCNRLQKLTGKDRQTGQRILMHGPPQYGKSIIVSQRFPSYGLGCDPESRFRVACYNVTHAVRFSKVNLALMQSPEFAEMFPNPECRVPDRTAADEWSTEARARKLDGNASFKALGLGTGFTGLGVDNLVIDDPYKNAQSARSAAINMFLWDWYTDVVKPRLNPLTNVIVMFHRWWEGDFAGRLMEEGGWELLRFPAVADNEGNDPTGRAPGALLSNRYPRSYLENIEERNPYSYFSLYQGLPKAYEGNFFHLSWFPIVPLLPYGCSLVRYWDLASSDSLAADATCGVLMARDTQGYYYVVDVVHGRWTAHERASIIKQTAALDRVRAVTEWLVPEPSIYIEQAPGLAQEPTHDLVRQLAGYVVYADRVTKDKQSRATPFQAQAQAGNVKLIAGAWNKSYLDELTSFPTGKHDDRVDATSGAFNKLAEGIGLEYGENPLEGYRG